MTRILSPDGKKATLFRLLFGLVKPIRLVALTADSQFLNHGTVTRNIFVFQVRQQTTTLSNHHQQPAAGVMIFLVLTKMIIQIVDVLRQDGDLNFRAPRIGFMRTVRLDQFLLTLVGNSHLVHLLNMSK
jgi:hypothetical protein